MTDLWPDDFGQVTVTPPIQILREQGALLSKKTGGLIEGYVQNSGAGNGEFHYSFWLRAPSLEDYSYRLLGVSHPIEIYPLRVESEILPHGLAEVDTEEEFVATLRTILSSEQTKKIVAAMMAQVRASVA